MSHFIPIMSTRYSPNRSSLQMLLEHCHPGTRLVSGIQFKSGNYYRYLPSNMAEKPDELNLPASSVARVVKETVSDLQEMWNYCYCS